MAYRYGDRYQLELFPRSINEYVSIDNPVRAYDAIIDSLRLEELGIELEEKKVGNSQYDPITMLKLLVYGYSYGIRSSRKLERACHNDVTFIWLMGNLKPDHKTIAEFRRRNKEELKSLMKEVALICYQLDLIKGNTLFVDGSKIRANASIDRHIRKEELSKVYQMVDKNVDKVLDECERVDEEEAPLPSYVKINEELKDKEKLNERIREAKENCKSLRNERVNLTDPDCVLVKGRQGIHAGYNVQIVVDGENGLIVNSDVVNESNDLNQFSRQIKQSQEVLGKRCEVACADSGYSNTRELKEVVEMGIEVIVPTTKQASDKEVGEFDKDKFIYNEEEDTYTCPESYKLVYCYTSKNGKRIYRFRSSQVCKNCCHYGRCTTAKRGRTISRLEDEKLRQELEAKYLEGRSQKIFNLRKQRVEHPFGHIKRNLGVSSFLLRGLEGVRAEMSILASCFNISRLITIFGVVGLIERLSKMYG